jgi:hypothetical protein
VFDAGAIESRLTVDLSEFDRSLSAAEARVRKFESERHEVRLTAAFDTSSMSRARQQLAQLDTQISRDAMSRLRSSPQGSVLGALNALFSPHPVTGAPSAQQAATQGLLGKMISAPGGGGPLGTAGGGGTVRTVLSRAAAAASPAARAPAGPGNVTTTDTVTQKLAGTGPGDVTTTDTVRERVDPTAAAKAEQDAKASGDRSGRGWMASFASWVKDLLPPAATGKAEKDAKSSGDRSGTSFFAGMSAHLGPFFAGFVKSSGDAGKSGGNALDKGLLGGIGPGILGVSTKVSGIVGGVGSLLGTLPALAGVAGTGMGVALIGGITAVVAKGAVAAVQPAVQAFQALQNAAPGKAQVAALKAYQNQLAQLTPAQQGLARSLEGMQAAWQDFVKSNTAGVSAIVSGGIGLLPGILRQMSGIFQAVAPQMGAVTASLGGLVQGLLGVARTAVPAFAPFISAVLGLVANILPGINVVIKATLPYISQFAGILGTLGRDLGSLFSTAAPAIGASMQILSGLLGLLGDLLPAVMKIAGIFATALAPVFTQFAGVIRTLIPPLVQIGGVIASFAGAVLGDLASAFGAVAVLIAHLAPSLTILAGTLSSVFAILENTGVFAVFGAALENVAVPLAGLVNALVTGLAPALPALVTALAQMSTVLAGALSAGLTAVLTALTPVVAFLARAVTAVVGFLQGTGLLVPVMTGLALAFGPVAGGLRAMAVGMAAFAGSSFVSGIAGMVNAVKGFMIVTEGATAAEKGMLLGEIALNAISPMGWAVIGAVAVTGLVVAFKALERGSHDLYDQLAAQDNATGFNIAGYQKLAAQLSQAAAGYQALSRAAQENAVHGEGGQIGQAAAQVSAQAAAVTVMAQNMQARLTALSGSLGVSQVQVEKWASAAGISAQKFAGAGENVGSLTSQIAGFVNKNAEAITSTASLGTNITIFGNDVFSATTQLDAFNAIWNTLVGNLLTKQQAVTQGQQSFDNLQQSITQSGTASTVSKQAFEDYITQIQSSLDALEKGGASVGDLNGYLQTQIDHLSSLHGLTPGELQDLGNLKAFQDALASSTHGLTGAQVTLITQFESSLIPDLARMGANTPLVTTAISNLANSIIQTGNNSASTAADRAALIKDLEGAKVSAQDAKTFVDNLQGSIDNLKGKVVTVGVTATAQGTLNAISHLAGQNPSTSILTLSSAAAGMLVTGGTPGKDSVLAMLMPGEVVVPTAMVRGGAVDHLKGSIPGFAAGGMVNVDAAGSWAAASEDKWGTAVAAAWAQASKAAFDAAAAAAAAAGTPVAYSKVAGVTQWENDVLKVLGMLGLPASDLPTVMSQMLTESGGNPNAINLTDCVTLDYVILTQRGWLRHDQVQPGDQTIGYNPETQRSEWTPVTRVVRYDDAEVWRIGNKHWHADVTPNHRWWSDTLIRVQPTVETCPECGWVPRGSKQPSKGVQVHRNKIHGIPQVITTKTTLRGEFARTSELRSAHRLRLAAPADTSGIPGLSLDDVRIIAWLQGDGTLAGAYTKPGTCPECGWVPGGRKPSLGPVIQPANSVAVHRAHKHGMTKDRTHGELSGYDGAIWQSKPGQVVKIRALLAHVEHTEAVRQRPGNHLPAHVFRLRRAYVTDLVKRSRLMETGPEAFVLALSPDQRAAWLDSMIDAEGHRQPVTLAEDGERHGGGGEFIRIAQADGPLQDAIKLAVYLEGYRPTYARLTRYSDRHQPAGLVGMARPHVAPSMFAPAEVLGRQPVWCVTTELGTWTTRGGDDLPFLTGNSNAAAGDPSRGLLAHADDHEYLQRLPQPGAEQQHLRPAGQHLRRPELRRPPVREPRLAERARPRPRLRQRRPARARLHPRLQRHRQDRACHDRQVDGRPHRPARPAPRRHAGDGQCHPRGPGRGGGARGECHRRGCP